MDEFDVAVVVFCRAQGVDERDAENRAEGHVSQVLRTGGLLTLYPATGQRAWAVAVRNLGAALNGYLTARPSAVAYKMAGLGEPRKGVED